MVIDMNETRLRTIEQIEQFLSASEQIEFTEHGDESDRYEHISRVLKRFDYPQRSKRERGVLRMYPQRTTGYSRAQVARLVTQWHGNRLATVPLKKRYRPPAAPFARKYTPSDIKTTRRDAQNYAALANPVLHKTEVFQLGARWGEPTLDCT